MKIQVRRGVFETNSSSTHSLTMCSKSDYDRWVSGELLLNNSWGLDLKGDFVTREVAIEAVKNSRYCPDDLDFSDEDEVNEQLREHDLYAYEYWGSEYLESFHSTFTTKTGEEIVAFGEYGYDG